MLGGGAKGPLTRAGGLAESRGPRALGSRLGCRCFPCANSRCAWPSAEALAAIFHRRRADPESAASTRAERERVAADSRQASANDAQRLASEERSRAQAATNELARLASEERGRAQAVTNEAARLASQERSRAQALTNEAARLASEERSRAQAVANAARHRDQDGERP